MKRVVALLIFLFFPLSSWAIELLPKEKATPVLPNPYSLSLNWWDYYDTDAKTLKARRDTTAEYFQKLERALPPHQAQEIDPYVAKILEGLDVLIKLKEESEKEAIEPNIPLKQQSYTYQQWLLLSKQMLEAQEELEYLQLRLNLANSSYQSSSKELDNQFAQYLKEDDTAPNRLIDGLKVIQNRILSAIEKNQLNQLETLQQRQQNKIAKLQESIGSAYRHIDFNTIDLGAIEGQIQAAQSQAKSAREAYVESYGQITDSTSPDGSLAEERLINNKIDYELAQVELINLEVQKAIVMWAQSEKAPTRKEHKNQLELWKTTIDSIQSDVSSTENSSELILQQSLKSLALQKNSYAESYSSNQSLELAESAILKIEQLKNSLYINQFLMGQLSHVKRHYHLSPISWVIGIWDNVIGSFSFNLKWFNQSLFKIGEYPVTPWALVKFVLILVIAVVLGKLSRHYIHKFGHRQRRIKMGSIFILSRISHYIIVVIGIAIAGYAIGLDLTIFAYIAGALAIWVGFSLQSIFHNFISGIIVLITKTIRMNDIIELDTGEFGSVTDLNLRTTVIRTFDGKDVVIPNADIVNKKYKNWTLSSHTLRIAVPFRVHMSADKEQIANIVVEAAKKVEITSDVQEPEVWISGFGENYINMELIVWINQLIRGKTASRTSQYLWAIHDAFKEQNIEIPLPMQSIKLSGADDEFLPPKNNS